MRITAVINQKGGVGKTTTAIALAHTATWLNLRTLLIDLDPQGNASSGVQSTPETDHWPQVLTRKLSWTEAAMETPFENLWTIPVGPGTHLENEVAKLTDADIEALRADLAATEWFDWALIDCPPSMGRGPRLGLRLADEVLIPVQCEYFAMEGLSQMLPMIEAVREQRGVELPLSIVLTMLDPMSDFGHEVASEVRRVLPDETLPTVIPRDNAFAEASSHGRPILDYDLRSLGAWSYLRLTKELWNGVETTRART